MWSLVNRLIEPECPESTKSAPRAPKGAPSLIGLACLTLLTGCGYAGYSLSGGGASTAAQSDNWELTPVAASVGGTAAPLTLLTGSIIASTTSNRVTAVLQATSGCYGAAASVPFEGSRSGSQADLRSFGDRGQYLTLSGQLDGALSSFNGTYKVEGGCGDGDRGTVTGTRYKSLTGQYGGSAMQASSTFPTTLNLVQGSATGEGTFQLSGSLAITGATCFSRADFQNTQGYVTGSYFQADFADTAGTKVHVQGRSVPLASTLQIERLTVTGNTCSATYGAFPMQRQ